MRPIRFVAAHEWKVKESVGAAEDVRPYRKIRLFGEMWHDLWCSGNEVMERGGGCVASGAGCEYDVAFVWNRRCETRLVWESVMLQEHQVIGGKITNAAIRTR